MKILKVIGVLIVGPVFGLLLGLVVGSLLLPPDPSGRGSPGDGILVMGCMLVGLSIFILISIFLARRIWHRSTTLTTQPSSQ
jgi:hypothetical protein